MKIISADAAKILVDSDWNRQSLSYVRHAATAINNVKTRLQLLDSGQHLIPVSINDGSECVNNSYVVSPLTAYTSYADYEIDLLGLPWLAMPLHAITKSLGHWLKIAQIDRIVQINNWLLSTNIYPSDWKGNDLPEITKLLVNSYPDHAIGFRSLNRRSNADLIEQMLALGYLAIPSRQVYLFEGFNGFNSSYLRQRDCRKDARFLAQTSYTRVSGKNLTDADYSRLETLYNMLYLEKYSPLNPQFSANWLRTGQRDGWLCLTALRSPTGSIDAVLGWFSTTNVLTTPVVGYDTSLPQKLGLYRLISQITLEEAANRRSLLNMSAGAAHFKRMRGGLPEIEYSMVLVRHLPRQRQWAWRFLASMLNLVAVPLMKKLKL